LLQVLALANRVQVGGGDQVPYLLKRVVPSDLQLREVPRLRAIPGLRIAIPLHKMVGITGMNLLGAELSLGSQE
jgi:hypothetical protein